MFISFEGIDACGKTTQIKRVADYIMQKWQKETVLTREPGGTKTAEKIRYFVLHTHIASPFAEALMMNAARYLHFDEVIKPALARDAWVLSDRFCHSTFAYQAEVGFDKLKQLHDLTTGSLYPDLTFILDISPEEATQRRRQQNSDNDDLYANDVYEGRDDSFKQKLRETYLEIAKNDEKCHVIDATLPVEKVTKQIIAIIQHYIDDNKGAAS
ncbi:MAG: dTMP kinase [Alphaproteobacteria bacterium]|nr:dTMP kinase [Alphaproteobacteria bacterium]